MLKQIILLNSGGYGKASIMLDDCASIQLVGPNNIGKSTLIYALNFLFIIDGKKMIFSGNRSGDKETLHYYFPSPLNSYVIFEIFKQRYYCIVVKRDAEGDLEYYRIDSEYKEKLFLKTEEGQQKILKFEEVRTNLIESGITLYPFKNKSEVFSFVYQRSKRNNAVVWLENTVVSDGLTNNFSKVYRYMINSKLINNSILKESLIIADNRDKEEINFSQKSRKEINDLLKINSDIKAIESIEKDFWEFRETVNQYKAKTKILGELIFAFNKQYEPTLIDQETHFQKKEKKISDLKIELNEILSPQKQKFDREIGSKGTELKVNKQQQDDLEAQLREINSFEGLDFLRESEINLDDNRRELESRITNIQTRGLSVKQIEEKILTLNATITRMNNQIADYSNQLIHKLTDKQKDKEILNYILSPDFSASQIDLVAQKIKKIDSLMQIFDGEIKLNPDLKGKKVASIEMLKEELISFEKEKNEYDNLLPICKDFESANIELDKVKGLIIEVKEKIKKIESKPIIENKLSELISAFKKIFDEKEKLEKDLKSLEDEITQKEELVRTMVGEKQKLEDRIKQLRGWKEDIEKIFVDAIENESTELLDSIYSKIKLHNTDRDNKKAAKDVAFEKLKNKIKSTIADEEVFIKFVEDEIALLPERKKSIDSILQAISTQFANPAHTLFRRYQEFKEFIYNKFNHRLSRTKISDIEAVRIELIDNRKLLDELKKISSIQEEFNSQTAMDFDQSENLKILNHFLDTGRKIEFHELFDIELSIKKNGKERKVDLEKQVESDGTDRMIRLVIVMSVINRLAINDEENTIVIFIDEIAQIDGKNRPELFKFCKEHNFLPICVSTEETMLSGFDKYYLLMRPKSGGKVNINEKQHTIRQSNLLVNERN